MKKVLCLVGTSVEVKDNHYDNTTTESMVLSIKRLDGTISDVVGVDRNGYIYSIRYNDDKELILLKSYGYGRLKDGVIIGVVGVDTDSYTIDGYNIIKLN